MTFKSLLKAVLAIAIIGAGAGIGWAAATATDPYAPGNATASPAAANVAVRPNTPLPTFTAAGAANPGQATPGAGAPNPGQTAPGAGGASPGQATPGASAPTTSGAGTATTSGAGQQRTVGQGNAGQGQRMQAITGTIESYDPATKLLTVKASDGQSRKFSATNARIIKNEKLSADEFGKLAGDNGIVIATGERGSDGSLNARSLSVVDLSSGQTGTAFPAGGGQPGNPGGGGGNVIGAGGANAPVIVRGGKLEGTKFSGASFTGEAVTVNLSDSTNLLKQGTGVAEDLKAGATVTVAARPAQGDAPADAQTVTLGS